MEVDEEPSTPVVPGRPLPDMVEESMDAAHVGGQPLLTGSPQRSTADLAIPLPGSQEATSGKEEGKWKCHLLKFA